MVLLFWDPYNGHNIVGTPVTELKKIIKIILSLLFNFASVILKPSVSIRSSVRGSEIMRK
jgi:hypothetical protein